MANPPIKGPLPQAPQEYNPIFAAEVIDRLDMTIAALARVIQTGYTTANVTKTRALDANSTSTAEIADVLCTLIEDMKARGMLG